ncbi:hypothetical protein LMG27174_05204 [Paraburkholderia rhynchosiae]|uniref:Uncharacterized protein n=1 Tax=Paraburkholderia rhynchosiae TaxID=487049 RepID=A0A6J5C1P9_9BURK|nr:hypothetical protein LMG27174_05204 [Paraburkholderia rhynchosiae]
MSGGFASLSIPELVTEMSRYAIFSSILSKGSETSVFL